LKKHFKYLKHLFIAVSLIAVASLVERNTLITENYQVNTTKFTKILNDKSKAVERIMDTVLQLSKPYIDKPSNFAEHLQFLESFDLKENGYAILVFTNDSLRYWSDNSIDFGYHLENSKLINSIVKLNNAWYYIKILHEKNIDILGLILLKNDYRFENEYLHNTFHPDFNLPSSIQISVVPLSYSFDIEDENKNYLFSLVPTNTIYSKNLNWQYIGLIYFLGIAFLFLFFDKWFLYLCLQHQNPLWKMLLLILFLVFARYLMLEFKYPLQLYSSSYFEPGYFAVSSVFPSLGDFFINALFILFLTRGFFYIVRIGKMVRLVKKQPILAKYIFGTISLAILLIYFNFIIHLLESLVINSSIPLEAHKVMELDYFSFLAYTIFAILLSSIVILTRRLVFYCRQILKTKDFVFLLIAVVFVYASIVFAFNMELSAASLIYLVVLLGITAYIQTRKRRYYMSFYIVLIALGATYITFFVNNTIRKKDQDKSGILISRLINERDKVAEHLLVSINENLKADQTLKQFVEMHGYSNLGKVHEYLATTYFGGYFAKYDLDIVVCSNSEQYDASKKLNNCSKYYGAQIAEYGNLVENTDFYYLDKHTSTVSYQGSVIISDDGANPHTVLYLMIDSRIISLEIGYPDLLIEGNVSKSSLINNYSYAKYQNGQLLSKSGSFHYDLNDKMFRNSIEGFSVLDTEDYHHAVFQDGNSRIVLTKPRVKSFDLIIAFSYVFVFFNVLLLLTLILNNLSSIRHQLLLNFENKLLVTMLFILALSFAMVTAGTVYYNTAQFEQKHHTNITEKLESVQKNLELEEEKGFLNDTLDIYKNAGRLNGVLKGLSNIYYTDINLYDFSGKLVASSRPEIFSQGLVGTFMNPNAFKEMLVNEKIRHIQNEQIGKLQYSSAYALFKTQTGKRPYFINLPYFTKPAELRKETSNLIVAIINLYVVLFIVVAMVSFLMASKITQPLRMLQDKFQNIELGKQSEQIVYNKKDEIGALVNEYNRMVIKLAESIDLLAKTERESAWREMAKQIAHEIKNPLTPMKLSVQFLQRSWQDKDNSFETKLQKCTQTLIDQINTLSNIASEFSNFAKMPKPNREIVNLVLTIENIVTLFSNTENLTISTNLDNYQELLIISDHEHISRGFTNLIKNGIQAIPSEREGHIKIQIEKNEKRVQVYISDNGTGITDEQKDKLFIPNFTTKSSGMGMGLPIVKDIIESANGKIWFETQLGQGSTFIVDLPLASEEELSGFAISEMH
jgi:two-component system, NtrC family, nitrogen regulation sensor histidine kinase NtrY